MSMQALKEWAVVCRALGEGRQVVLLRKGGIQEYRNGFQVKHSKFFLFPTFEHQQREHIQANYRPRLDDILKQVTDPSMSEIELYAEAIDVKEIADRSALKALEPYHIWTESYVNARMDYNPSKPMSVLLLRVFKLDVPITVENKPAWAGCKSWIPLERDGQGTPVIDDSKFSELSSPVRQVLSLAA